MARSRDKNKRARLIAASFEEFGARGFAATRVSDIARRARVAPGTVYTYFNDKEHLFRCTVQHGWDEFQGALNRLLETPGEFHQRFEGLLDYGFALLHRIYPIVRGMSEEANRLDLLNENLDRLCAGLERLLENRPGSGGFFTDRDPALRVYFLKIAVLGILFKAALVQPEELGREIAEIKAAVKEGFLRPPPGGDSRPERPGTVPPPAVGPKETI